MTCRSAGCERAAALLFAPKGLVSRWPLHPPTLDNVIYGIGRVDASGRVIDRSIESVLG